MDGTSRGASPTKQENDYPLYAGRAGRVPYKEISMTTNDFCEKLGLTKLSEGSDREIVSCYISDLLSRVLGGCSSGDIWITVQASVNMVAVATMADASCVILPESLTAPDNVVGKATEEGLTVFSSNDDAFMLALKIASLLELQPE